MDMRTEASRYPAEAIPRTAEKKDSFRSNNENHRGKQRKKHKKQATVRATEPESRIPRF